MKHQKLFNITMIILFVSMVSQPVLSQISNQFLAAYDFTENEYNIQSSNGSTCLDIGNASGGGCSKGNSLFRIYSNGTNTNVSGASILIFPDVNNTGGIGLQNLILSSGYFFNISLNQNLTAEWITSKVPCYLIRGADSDFCNDATGSGTGTPFTRYNRTVLDIVTSSATEFTELMTIPITINKNFTIDCVFFQNSSATTTGVQYNVSLGGAKNFGARITMTYFTTITAINASCNRFNNINLTCYAPTALTTDVTVAELKAAGTQVTSAPFSVGVQSEVGASAVKVWQGSWCRSVEV